MQTETIISRLARIAAQRPESLAIVDGEVRVTYGQLDAASSAIAGQLGAASGERHRNVCLLFANKQRGIAAIAGAIRGGHACVPLDAGDPEERLRFILQDSEPVALLTDREHVERAQVLAPAGCTVIDIGVAERGSATRALPAIDPAELAYVSYTSGSTGVPKGVTQTHANLLFFVDSYATDVGIGPADRLSVLAPLGVPAVLGDILRGIALGATLCVCDIRRSGVAQLADWLDRQRITVLHTVPTVFREMANRMGPRRVLPHLRVVHLGGEGLFGGDVAQFRARTLDHCVLVNQLASTETSAIARNIIRHDTHVTGDGPVAAGRPVAGLRVEIRRDDGALAAPDEVGEVFVCGAHLSPGYWRRPDLDALAFSVDPLHAGWRRFRSGDLGRVDAEGRLNFIGRTGTRVKVHGHSVDLMEVEAALATCPGVVRAAMIADEAQARADSSRLVAYVEADPSALRDAAMVRRHLASRLPQYMLPAAIHFIAAMPLTVGGKIDRRRLGEVATLPSDAGRAAVAPRDDTERAVARVFARLLSLEVVGADDDFFLIGGDSLLGAELQAALAREFGVRVANFHEDATVAGIAAGIRRERSAARAREIPIMLPLWRNGGEIPLFVVHGRHGQAFVSQHFMRLLGDEQPIWAFQARGLDGASEPHASLEAMADEYLAEMRSVRPRGPYFLGALCAGVFIVTIMARRLRELGETVLPLLLLDPPNSVFQPGFLNMSPRRFEEKMRARKAEGGSGGPVEDPAYMKALIRTVLAFERAIALHRPLPYHGDAFMLSSSVRLRGEDASYFAQMFPGNIVRHEIGTTHRNAMSPHNPEFARALLQSVGRIRAAARHLAHNTAHDAAQDTAQDTAAPRQS